MKSFLTARGPMHQSTVPARGDGLRHHWADLQAHGTTEGNRDRTRRANIDQSHDPPGQQAQSKRRQTTAQSSGATMVRLRKGTAPRC